MPIQLQKASMWKRISAWLMDFILLTILVVFFAMILSAALGYDGYSNTLDAAYAKYEKEYGITFDIDELTYEAMTKEEKANYDAAYEALLADEEAIYAYNMVINLTMVITSISILLGVAVLEYIIPLILKNGQTLGKKIFGIAIVRKDSVKMNLMQLFVRAMLGKYVVGIMLPVLMLVMLFWGLLDFTGLLLLLGLLLGQFFCVICSRNRCAIHDLLAGTVAVDISSQKIFESTQDLIEYTKKIHAERAASEDY